MNNIAVTWQCPDDSELFISLKQIVFNAGPRARDLRLRDDRPKLVSLWNELPTSMDVKCGSPNGRKRNNRIARRLRDRDNVTVFSTSRQESYTWCINERANLVYELQCQTPFSPTNITRTLLHGHAMTNTAI